MVEESGSGARDLEPAASRSGWVSTAWAEWAGWRGPPELAAQIARAALWAVSEEVTPVKATCSIELHVGADVERFDDPREFADHATRDGLRRFSRLDIRVRQDDGDIRIRLSPLNVRLGRPGVVLLASAGERARAERMRDVVAASIGRRTGRHRQASGTLEGSRLLLVDLLDHPSRRAQRRARSAAPSRLFLGRLEADPAVEEGRVQRAWRALVDPFATNRRPPDVDELDGPAIRWARWVWQAILVVWATALILALAGDPGSGELASWGSGLVVAFAVVGAAGWAVVRWIRPRVEVTPTSRLQQILSLVWKGLLAAVVSAAIGKSIELLIG